MLDKKMAKSDTYRASKNPMSVAPKLAVALRESESTPDSNMTRLAKSLARDQIVIASLRTSEHDIRRGRILSNEQVMRRLRKAEVLVSQ